MARSSYSGPDREISDAQLANLSRQGDFVLAQQPVWMREAVDLWEKKGGGGSVVLTNGKARFVSDDDDAPLSGVTRSALPGGVPRGISPGIAPVRSPSTPRQDSHMTVDYIYTHGVQGTSAQSAEVKPTDPIRLADIEISSDDATARITSIKQGSRELLGYANYGILVSKFNASGFFRGVFEGLVVSKTDPLNVTLVHAGSGTNTTNITLLGESQSPASCPR